MPWLIEDPRDLWSVEAWRRHLAMLETMSGDDVIMLDEARAAARERIAHLETIPGSHADDAWPSSVAPTQPAS